MKVTRTPAAAKDAPLKTHERALLDQKPTAQMLSVSIVTLLRWERLGLISRVELPDTKRALYRRADVEALAANLPAAPAPPYQPRKS